MLLLFFLEYKIEIFKLYNTIHYWNRGAMKQHDWNKKVKKFNTKYVQDAVIKRYESFIKVLDALTLKEEQKPEIIQSIRFEARVRWAKGTHMQIATENGVTPGIFLEDIKQTEVNHYHARLVLENLLDLALAVIWKKDIDERQKVFKKCGLQPMPDLRDHFEMVGVPLSALKEAAPKIKDQLLEVNLKFEEECKRNCKLPRLWKEAMDIILSKYEIECGCSNWKNRTSEVQRYINIDFKNVMGSFVDNESIDKHLANEYEKCNDPNRRWTLVKHYVNAMGFCGGRSKSNGFQFIKMPQESGPPKNLKFHDEEGSNRSLKNLLVKFKTHHPQELDEDWPDKVDQRCTSEKINHTKRDGTTTHTYIKKYAPRELQKIVMGKETPNESPVGDSNEDGHFFWNDVIQHFKHNKKVRALSQDHFYFAALIIFDSVGAVLGVRDAVYAMFELQWHIVHVVYIKI